MRFALRLDQFPLDATRRVTLELHSFQVTGPGATIVEGTDDGDVVVPFPDVMLFRGQIADAPESWVFLGVTPDRINGTVFPDAPRAPTAPASSPGAGDTARAGTISPPPRSSSFRRALQGMSTKTSR